jgi:large subunit ribosomal protein L24
MTEKFKIKRGDRVVVISGRDKGKTGEVLRVLRGDGRAVVQGVNMMMKHQRPTQTSPGGINELEAPIQISNLAIADPKDGSPTRVGYRFLEDGSKVRYAKRSGEVIDSGA